MNFEEWQKKQRALQETCEPTPPPDNNFYGRKNELLELNQFIDAKDKKNILSLWSSYDRQKHALKRIY